MGRPPRGILPKQHSPHSDRRDSLLISHCEKYPKSSLVSKPQKSPDKEEKQVSILNLGGISSWTILGICIKKATWREILMMRSWTGRGSSPRRHLKSQQQLTDFAARARFVAEYISTSPYILHNVVFQQSVYILSWGRCRIYSPLCPIFGLQSGLFTLPTIIHHFPSNEAEGLSIITLPTQ